MQDGFLIPVTSDSPQLVKRVYISIFSRYLMYIAWATASHIVSVVLVYFLSIQHRLIKLGKKQGTYAIFLVPC